MARWYTWESIPEKEKEKEKKKGTSLWRCCCGERMSSHICHCKLWAQCHRRDPGGDIMGLSTYPTIPEWDNNPSETSFCLHYRWIWRLFPRLIYYFLVSKMLGNSETLQAQVLRASDDVLKLFLFFQPTAHNPKITEDLKTSKRWHWRDWVQWIGVRGFGFKWLKITQMINRLSELFAA